MTQGYQQTRADLESHLAKQIAFMKRSAESYDTGFVDEATRLAACLRVLLHDTKNSISLLTQLGEKDRYYWDSRAAIDKGIAPDCDSCFVMVQVADSGARYIPALERGPIPMLMSDFDIWWSGVVFIDGKDQRVTRKELILSVANQDGGAHVDPSLNTKYADLSKNNSFGWSAIEATEKKPLTGVELAAVRQITHEVLKTLDSNYAPVAEPLRGMVVGLMNPSIRGLAMEFRSQEGHIRLHRNSVDRGKIKGG